MQGGVFGDGILCFPSAEYSSFENLVTYCISLNSKPLQVMCATAPDEGTKPYFPLPPIYAQCPSTLWVCSDMSSLSLQAKNNCQKWRNLWRTMWEVYLYLWEWFWHFRRWQQWKTRIMSPKIALPYKRWQEHWLSRLRELWCGFLEKVYYEFSCWIALVLLLSFHNLLSSKWLGMFEFSSQLYRFSRLFIERWCSLYLDLLFLWARYYFLFHISGFHYENTDLKNFLLNIGYILKFSFCPPGALC